MRRRSGLAFVLALAAAAGVACHSSRAQAPGASEAAWYDAQPLLVSLRPSARDVAARAAGVVRLEDLPLYDLDLAVDPAARSFTLGETLWLTNTTGAPLSEVVLRVYANATGDVRKGGPAPVRLARGSCTLGGACTVTPDGASAIDVRLGAPLSPGGHLKIALALQGTLEVIDSARTSVLAQGLEGLPGLMGGGEGSGDYGLLAVGDGIASLASFYAVLARRNADGTWERSEPSALGDLGSDDLSNVRAAIDLPAGDKLAVSGVVVSEQASDAGAGMRRAHVVASMVRDFSLVTSPAFAVLEKPVGDVTVRSYALSAERAEGEKALDVAAWALADFEKRFGPYPYADFDVAESAIVGGAGGVEFSGLVTAASMLYRPPDSGPGGGEIGELLKMAGMSGALSGMTGSMLEFCVAHEVAHQWWHGLVGSDSRAHPFADEGLAQYSAVLYLEDRYGKERARRDGDMNAKMGYQTMRLMGTPDAPVDRPVEAFGSSLAYGGLIYGKGPYFYAALRRAMGDEAFFAAVREYVARYRFRQAPGRGLVDLAAAGPDEAKVQALAAHWLDESHGDEDLGTLDLGELVGSVLGGGGGKEMQDLMKILGGGGLVGGKDAGAGKGRRPGAAPQGADERILDELLRAMGGD